MVSQNPSFVLQKAGEVSFEERPIPKINESHDVKIQVLKTGICGSDIHYYVHGKINDFVVEAPMVLGHESSGVVVEVGPGVTSLKVGDRVAMEPGVPDRYSTEFKAGKYNLDPAIKFAATPPYDGTLCKYYILPEDFCVKLPDHLSLEEGALVEPLSVAVHAVKNVHISPGAKVAVFGAGPIGLVCAAVAKAYGASAVVNIDLVEERLALARTMGATATHVSLREDSVKQTADKLRKLLGGDADAVLECTGAGIPALTGLEVLKPAGVYMQVGMGSGKESIPLSALIGKELTVKGSFRYDYGDYKLSVELISSGLVNVKPMITKTFEFDQCPEAYEYVKAGKGVKVIINGPK